MQRAWSLIRRNGQRSWNFLLTHRSLPIAVTVLGIVGLVVVVNFAPSAVRPDGSEEYLGWGNWVFVPSLLLVAIGAAATILSFKTQESRAERIERLTKALDTHRGAETPRETRSCLSAQVSLLAWRSAPRSPCRGISPPRPGVASGIFGTKSGPRQLHDRLGFLAVPRLWGLPDSPQAQAVGFPTHTHRYSESPYGSSPARFPASICSAAWDRFRI